MSKFNYFTFTDHSIERIKERGFTKEYIEKLLREDKPIKEEVQRIEKEVQRLKLYYKLDDLYYLCVVVEIRGRSVAVVTVFKNKI